MDLPVTDPIDQESRLSLAWLPGSIIAMSKMGLSFPKLSNIYCLMLAGKFSSSVNFI